MISKPNRRKEAAPYAQFQQKRRELALKKQGAARQQKVQQARSLAQAALQDAAFDATPAQVSSELQQQQQQHVADSSTDASMQDATAEASASGLQESTSGASAPDEMSLQLYGLDGVDSSRLSGAALRDYFAQQLMVPEWLTDTPPDLATNWLVMPRPEGKRCLVISSGGSTVSRTRTGSILHRFNSRLPAGGPCSSSGSFCVLDCIYQQQELPHLPHEAAAQQQHHQQHHQQHQQQDMDTAGPDTAAQANNSSSSSSRGAHGVQPGGVYYIQDVLVWRGYSLVDCGAEFRLFWLASKLCEEAEGGWSCDGGHPRPGHEYRFHMLPYWPATPDGLQAAATAGSTSAAAAAAAASTHAGETAVNGTAHSLQTHACMSSSGPSSSSHHLQQEQQQQHHKPQPQPQPQPQSQQQQQQQQQQQLSFTQDGLYLRHTGGHYALGGVSSPLALLWKDESCSRYLLDTDAAGVVPEQQQVVLQYQGPDTGGVATADTPPVVLGRLPAEFVASMQKVLQPGRLLRFNIREGGIVFNPTDGRPVGADLGYAGPANQRRGRADQFSKVVFQWQARRQPVLLADLQAAAAAGAASGGVTDENMDAQEAAGC